MAERIALACDHRGHPLARALRERLQHAGYEVRDFGTDGAAPVDYPDFAGPAAEALSRGEVQRAIVICGSGLGVCYTANRFPRVRAAWVQDVAAAEQSRRHNDANALALSAERLDAETAWPIVERWLATAFEGGRHARRIAKIDQVPRRAWLGELGRSGALEEGDPEIAELVRAEARRQALGLELIASENFVSEAVLEAAGTVLTNKYAEGYPGRRWYGGCEVVDRIEQLAIDRARELFGAEHANVQPHSGSQANFAVYTSVLQPGDKVLGMNLSHGGHLTHGNPANFSGKLYRFSEYGVREADGLLDYDELAAVAAREKPKLITVGASAYSRVIDFARMGEIARANGALLFADIAHIAGLVATGLHPSPVPHADFVTTTTHKTLRGPRGGLVLCRAQHAKALDAAVFPGGQGGPLMHVIAAKAVALREAARPDFRGYCEQIVANARALAGALAARGFRIVSGGTDTHLFLLSLIGRDVTGRAAQIALEEAGITVNKNMVPFDPRKPAVTSGIRIGTPALTTRGMKEAEMEQIAAHIARVLDRPDDAPALASVRREVEALCRRFPLYASRWSDAE
ncbi:MAG TPA: serine hydroxymethyltransferase [Myxococcota bacterium]|nr:serine hydroxymethyltransferase [Myxococcota bacterium]